jgi:hypothetical protein
MASSEIRKKKHCVRVLENVNRQRELFADVTFYCGEITFCANKVVLAACSPVFEKMFLRFAGEPAVYIIREIEPQLFNALLDFIYTGELDSQISFFLFLLMQFALLLHVFNCYCLWSY